MIPKARRHGLRLLVTSDTILRWHRDIVRRRWATRSMRGSTGRPAIRRNVKALVLRLARENTEWGYRRIHGELAGLEVKVAASTVWEILKASDVDPAPATTDRAALAAVPVFSGRGHPGMRLLHGRPARRHPGSRAGRDRARDPAHTHPRRHPAPDREWTTQQARNLLMDLGGQAEQMKFMIRDRGSNFTAAFDAVLAGAGIRTVLCNVRTPRMNAIAERWIRRMPTRAAGPHPRLEPGPSAADPARLRDPPQPASAAPLKPLPEPVDLDQYRVRRQKTRVGTINEYRLVA